MPRFTVLVDDNFHYMDEDERYCAGEFDTLEEAVAKCRRLVDNDLHHLHKPGMSAETLFETYTSFGEEPWIQGGTFSAQDYARQRCAEVCGTAGSA